ncbi:hypothetical protein HanRHA438_Chr11g0509741 [Helianthus annuus]|nr:hypothetical protein HanHA300_Chr11g0407821 [Helianthus annuus]KAJ0517950.1 hypothetical protein HanHA89_Chr11g0431521 [Helianthus annuus]KAJ0685970.1 hypothetical protein HanLR1_Chr11g0409061 [Helianthus annuus]KAJ0871227.1 hypothetical protein HanRHA438_Chr11g0509741 [Helianthus annuus]
MIASKLLRTRMDLRSHSKPSATSAIGIVGAGAADVIPVVEDCGSGSVTGEGALSYEIG